MPKFKYVGIEGIETPAVMYHYGQRFERGEVTEIKDETHAQKLKAQEGFEEAGDDEETVADKQVKAAKEANAKAREEEQKKRDAERGGQKYKPLDDDEDEDKGKLDTGTKDQKKAKKRDDRIHAKSGYTSGNLSGKDDAKPGATSQGQDPKAAESDDPHKMTELGPSDDWEEPK